jgi:hypothetical protein
MIDDLKFCEKAKQKLVELNSDKYLYLHFKFDPDTGVITPSYDKSSVAGPDNTIIAVMIKKGSVSRSSSQSNKSVTEEVQEHRSRKNSESKKSIIEEVQEHRSRKNSESKKSITQEV